MTQRKKARRELALKKAKQKRIIIIAVAVIVVVAVAAAVTFSAVNTARTETYAEGSIIVELRPNGRFNATMFHGESYRGTYVKTADGAEFTYDGVTVPAVIEGNILLLPSQWDDGHGHSTVLTKR